MYKAGVMLALSRKVACGVPSLNLQCVRHHSQQSRKSGGGTVLSLGITSVTVGIMGTVGYAAWSEENRKSTEDFIPGMSYVTDFLLGPVSTAPPPARISIPHPPPAIAKPLPKARQTQEQGKDDTSSIMKKKMDREKMREQEGVKETEQVAAVPMPPLTNPPAPATQTPAPAPSSLRPTSASTEPTLSDVLTQASEGVTAALHAAEVAAATVHRQAVRILQSSASGELDQTFQASVAAAATLAEQAYAQAQRGVSDLSACIACTKRTTEPGSSEAAAAEATLATLEKAVIGVKELLAGACGTARTLEVLLSSVPEAHSRVLADLIEVLPPVKGLEPEQQANLLLAHTYNRTTTLQKQIHEKQKALEEMRTRGGDGDVNEEQLQERLDQLRHQLYLQHKSDLSRQKDELEAEVRGQLKRQTEAHTEHLMDSLTRQENELQAHWQMKLYDELSKERDRNMQDIAAIRGRLLGLQSAVSARADADASARAARKLWLACQALGNTLRLGREGASSWDQQLQPLQGHLAAIGVAGDGDTFVSGVLGSVSGVAAERGVYTHEALRHRYRRVDTMARRVAMIPENGGSLLRYLLSYVQSMLLLRASAAPTDADLLDQPIDIHKLSTFDLLDRASACLAADDLLGGVRWLTQLTGESRRVAQDWCVEARMSLELRQAADALMAHAAATTATAL